MATNFKESYQELIKYIYNNVRDNNIFDDWISFDLTELTTLIRKLEKESLKFNTLKVKPCHDAKFKKINCLEMGDKLGFFNSDADFRPGHAIWLKKEHAERLFELFKR
jgi:hypothetical protein